VWFDDRTVEVGTAVGHAIDDMLSGDADDAFISRSGWINVSTKDSFGGVVETAESCTGGVTDAALADE
jgi:hypothetical protein